LSVVGNFCATAAEAIIHAERKTIAAYRMTSLPPVEQVSFYAIPASTGQPRAQVEGANP
jgi:hypothetical protein